MIMKAKLIVEKAGLFTTVQDFGRYGYQQFGVPVSGAMDKYALQVANLLVGNPRGEASLEITLPGFSTRITEDCQIALAGADLGAVLGGRQLSPWRSAIAREGEVLSFNEIKSGTRAYLAVAGGFKLPEVMGSKSTYVRGKLGGLEGRQLKKGDELEIINTNQSSCPAVCEVPHEYKREYTNEVTVRCVPGPQDEFFPQQELEKFFNSQYTITQQSDRMGYRLEGPAIKHKGDFNIITEGLTLGAVQIIGDGKPIVMMADHHSAGGYSKIAHVITVDMHFLAQMKPGDKVSFQKIDVEEAQMLLGDQEEKLKKLERQLIYGEEDQVSGEREKGRIRIFKVLVDGKEYSVLVEEID